MALTPQQLTKLQTLLATAPYAGLSDADAATLANAPVPATVGRPAYITSQLLASHGVWGIATFATVRAAMQAQIAAGGAAGAQAAALIALLDGQGINPADPQVAPVIAQFVTSGLITQAQADAVNAATTPTQLPLGPGVTVAAADVTLARGITANAAGNAAARAQDAAGQRAVAALYVPGQPSPTAAARIAAFTAQITA